MHHQLIRQFKFGDSAQILFENCSLDLELIFVSGVLVMASAAALKVGAVCLGPIRRWSQNVIQPRPGKTGFVPDHGRFDFFASQDERHEHGLAAAIFVGWQAGQPISAINQFFYVEIQALILTGEDDF